MHIPSDEDLLAAIERLSHADNAETVILTKVEAREVREALVLFRKGKLMKSFFGYVIACVAAYAAFKADLGAFFGGGK